MIGGVLLGGLSSALVRVAAAHGSLRHLFVPLRHAALALLVLAAAITLSMFALPQWATMGFLIGAVALFGLAVQTQTAILTLLRAAEATLTNAVASLSIVLLVPLALHLMLGADRTLTGMFLFLACAFAIGTLLALICARYQLRTLFADTPKQAPGLTQFLANASSFTAVNVFSYAIVNIDFTLFRLIGSPQDFALMATGKIFFERFVLPALMVFAGAIQPARATPPARSWQCLGSP